METPAPVDLNKLKAILGNAKKVMKAADEKFPKGNKNQGMNESYDSGYSMPSTPMYSEMDEREPEYPQYSSSNAPVPQHRDYTEEDIMNSNLPPIVKEAMRKNPIPRPSMGALNSSFSLEGLEDLIEKPAKRPAQPRQTSAPLRESAGEPMYTISASQLNEIIDNRINKALAEMFTKTISEQTIKKTINTLVSEGKITVRKK